MNKKVIACLCFACMATGIFAMDKKKSVSIVKSDNDIQEVRIEVLADALKHAKEKRGSLIRESEKQRQPMSSPVLLNETKDSFINLGDMVPRLVVNGVPQVVSDGNVTSRGTTPRDDVKGSNVLRDFGDSGSVKGFLDTKSAADLVEKFALSLEKKEDQKQKKILEFLEDNARNQPHRKWPYIVCAGVSGIIAMQMTIIGMMIALLARP
jgi:hypothetical protein